MADERTTSREPPTRLADGALAGAVLAIAIAVVWNREIDVSSSAILFGSGSTVGFEVLAGRDPERVRRLWARPTLRAVIVSTALCLGVFAVVVSAGWLVIAGAAALGCYFVVLVLAASGIVPPPETWADRQ
ncbi:hypothetical protein [Halococcus sp. PRR34]|uniref:hypothetical protein n=1 Tax=Halococcus sp. PRR34 TaxID=3020830 RepID=UPI0023616830|nr:hypothetical protein [Halococcus sp. PRR34]